jgi:hypothetical protein
MFWWTLLAAAQPTADETMAFLEQEAPRAEALLEQCAVDGCDRAEAADAAFVLAMDAYLGAGEADGVLAATVRALSTEVFADLPEVVQRAATEPLPFTQSVGGAEGGEALAPPAPPGVGLGVAPPDPPPLPATPPPPAPPAPRSPVYLSVEVVDHDGQPIPHARVRFPVEGDVHHVHDVTGRWTGSVLYLSDGTERPFAKRQQVDLHVWAPGYRYQKVAYATGGRRKNLAVVRLTAGLPEAPAQGHPLSDHAFETHERWIDGVHEGAHEALAGLERDAAEAARAWLDAGGGAEAWELCMAVGTPALCGEG